MASHALLLRLFLSPSFFSVHVALRYLRLYSDNIGITYYLTRRLRELDTQDLREVWGFICHLLVTRPSKSRALECFVGEVAQRSTHIAMITLWFMQATLKDLASSPHDSQSFMICQRVLHKCHEIIYGDLPPPPTTPYASLSRPYQLRPSRRKLRHHAEPVIVGIGLILAGAPAMPRLTEIMGEVAIEQSRVEEAGSNYMAAQDDAAAHPPGQREVHQDTEPADEETGSEQLDDDSPSPSSSTHTDEETTTQTSTLSRRRTIGASQTVPTLPLHLRKMRHSHTASDDPLGQLDADYTATPYQSTPSISTPPQPRRSTNLNEFDELLERYDPRAQSQLLRSHYCRSEVHFILTLENISNRLLVVPRPARVSALRAELTALNHKLPAEICMPMWCTSSDAPRTAQGPFEPHHRIVRIPPGESVVLNSAERAPYLLLIEVIHDDLSFDPSKRGNKEILKKIVQKEHVLKGASRDLVNFTPPSNSRHHFQSSSVNDSDVQSVNGVFLPRPTLDIIPPTPASPLPDNEEEVDLVEQLYGADPLLKGKVIDLSESIVLPPAPKNKDLDMAAWSRSMSGSASPEPSSVMNTPQLEATRSPHFPGPGRISLQTDSPLPSATSSHVISLDEYSERMRTAAIMLTQLNATLIREPSSSIPIPNIPVSIPNAVSQTKRWLPSSSWLSGAEAPANKGPVHPSLTNNAPEHPQGSPSRMRLQHAEAAAIRDRIMQEMLSLEEERMDRMKENRESERFIQVGTLSGTLKSVEDEGIIRRELNKADPSAVVFSESWAAKKSRIRNASPYGHLSNWDCVSVIVKTGGDLRQEQLAVQLIHEFQQIWEEENCACWVRYFRILITGGTSGLVETITDAVSIHSIKKAEYARRLAQGRLEHVTLFDHFKSTYGDPSSSKFIRAQRNFAKSLAGYSVVTYLLQIKDRHNGNILLDRDGHLIHIDFGFILSNSPGNIGFEAAPFKLPPEYVEVLGGVEGQPFLEFKRLFREGFEAARKHCDRIITLVELMQKDSTLPCFVAFGEQTANQLRDRFQPALTHSLVGDYVDRLIDSSLGSHWTRLYDSYQYYSQSIL